MSNDRMRRGAMRDHSPAAAAAAAAAAGIPAIVVH
jgi:hypothetical protein